MEWALTSAQAATLGALGLAGCGVAILLAGERIASALRRHTRTAEELALAGLNLTRDIHADAVVTRDAARIRRALDQVVLDATGRLPGLHTVVLVAAYPSYILAEGEGQVRYVFSPYRITRDGQGRRLNRAIKRFAVSPVVSHSFVVEQLEAIYRLLTEAAADMHAPPPPLPRVAEWQLLVVPAGAEIDF